MTTKYTVVTTFNAQGYERYARKMIQTFLANWPQDVQLVVYAEGVTVQESAPNLTVLDLESASPELVSFKTRWRGIPKANGDVSSDPIRNKRKDAGKGFKWDAIRFAHKVYSIAAAAKSTNNWLIWMDADMVCHSPVSNKFLNSMFTGDICFLGRKGKYTECGLYGINLSNYTGRLFINKFQEFYDQDTIFTFAEWHDSYVFDEVRKHVRCQERDWSSHLITGEGHPLINSEWGAFLDHLKGDRKTLGRSKDKDLKVQRTESYWS